MRETAKVMPPRFVKQQSGVALDHVGTIVIWRSQNITVLHQVVYQRKCR